MGEKGGDLRRWKKASKKRHRLIEQIEKNRDRRVRGRPRTAEEIWGEQVRSVRGVGTAINEGVGACRGKGPQH